eukprot:COSAG06_NODE_10497_length_1669_cov_6.059198_2_plen_66_part_00
MAFIFSFVQWEVWSVSACFRLREVAAANSKEASYVNLHFPRDLHVIDAGNYEKRDMVDVDDVCCD